MLGREESSQKGQEEGTERVLGRGEREGRHIQEGTAGCALVQGRCWESSGGQCQRAMGQCDQSLQGLMEVGDRNLLGVLDLGRTCDLWHMIFRNRKRLEGMLTILQQRGERLRPELRAEGKEWRRDDSEGKPRRLEFSS